MTEIANAAQVAEWNGEGGNRGAADADRRDRVLAPIGFDLLQAAQPSTGERVLDVGCGCGATAIEAAQRVGRSGAVLGVDLSEPMLAVARERCVALGVDTARFEQADVQVDGPGMFSQSDPSVLTTTLEQAGLSAIEVVPVTVRMALGTHADEAADYLATSGIGRRALETIPERSRADALDAVRAVLSEHADPTGVRLSGAIWITAATRAREVAVADNA